MNDLNELNKHLFDQLSKLNDENLTGEKLEEEICRAKAMTDVSKSIIESAGMTLSAVKLKCEYTRFYDDDLNPLLGHDKSDGDK